MGIVLTIFGGIALAVQAGINASLAVNTTKPFAGRQPLNSICIGLQVLS